MRLTDKQKAAIVHEFAAGKGIREIARKFQVTHTAVSKILKNAKVSKVESGNLPQESDATKRTRKEIREDILDNAYGALYRKAYNELSAETLLKIIDRMTFIDSIATDDLTAKEELQAIVAQIVRVSDGADGETN